MKLCRLIFCAACLLLFPLLGWTEEQPPTGSVCDAETGRLLSGVKLWSESTQVSSDAAGRFELSRLAGPIIVKYPGYRPLQLSRAEAQQIKLQPFSPKALYLSFWAADSQFKRSEFQQLIDRTDINALVIDLKSSRGHIAYRSNIPLASEIGAQRIRPLKDLPDYLAELKRRGIYSIGRIVVFKDDLLAKQRPELAVHGADGELWQDRDQLSWSDPFNQQVRDYNLAIAEEAAQLGFDELQFDYIRFPSRSDLQFSQAANDDSRVAAINVFLDQVRERLAPYPTFISANIFGYICWKHKDGKIGQRLVDLAERVDYLSPMLYPSGFPHGIPGYSKPLDNPYQVIARSLQVGQQLSGLDPVRFRPWLQAFRDYAFDRRGFKAADIHAQINASDANGSNGWMLWNAASRFSLAGLQHQMAKGDLNLVDVSPKEVPATIISQAIQTPNEAPAL